MSAKLLRIMREALAKRSTVAEGEAESGFTLIELMVVLLILAILLAIAIPTFLGVTGSAYDRSAQSNLTNEMTAAQAQYANAQSFASAQGLAAALNSSNPNIIATTGASTGLNTVSVYSLANGAFAVFADWSPKTNTCWWAATNQTDAATSGGNIPPGTHYASTTGTTTVGCNAANGSGGKITWNTSY